ncbi:MAG TPA: hypothetical protein VG106_12130 [Vicinamibacterales bacterium]|nr:hypothetical protein [Vicinamibacterales bacterium]
MSAAQVPQQNPGALHRVTREYTKHGEDWLLKHSKFETEVEGPRGKARHVLHLKVTSRTFHRNKQKDAERAKLRAQLDSARASGQATRITPSQPLPISASSECDNTYTFTPCDQNPYPGGGGGVYDPPAPNETVLQTAEYAGSGQGAGPSLILQHGYFSHAGTWERMSGWLRRDMVVPWVAVRNIDWRQVYENQAAQLHSRVTSNGDISANGAILIGHSNGGMVSRYFSRNPNVAGVGTADLRGVITIGTPHWGTWLAKRARSVNRLFNWGGGVAFLLCGWSHTGGCQSFQNISGSTMRNIYYAFLTPNPVLNQMQPWSSYHYSFNSQPEGFRRFGITSLVYRRWIPWRMYGDAYCYPESNCGGDAQVKKIDRIYHRDIKCSIISGLLGGWGRAVRCAADAVFLRAVDGLYNGWVDKWGDGVVPGSSQRYPNIPDSDIRVIDGGPAHVGETKDRRVGQLVEMFLRTRMDVGQINFTP